MQIKYRLSLVLAASLIAMPVVAQTTDMESDEPQASALSAFIAAEVFTGFTWVTDDDFTEFELGRAELTSGFAYQDQFGLELTLEAIRSVTPESVLGVDGNSLVLRIKRAYGFGRVEAGPVDIEARAGLIHDPWIEASESGYDFRGLSPLLAERGDFYDTSDLGASAIIGVLDNTLRLHIAALNGEGRNDIERNSGKNLQAVLSFTPTVLDTLRGPGVLGIHVSGREGSTGVSSIRNHRLSGAVTFAHPRYNFGAELHRAWGYAERGSREVQGAGLWAGGSPIDPWLGVVVRADLLDMDLDADETGVLRLMGGLYTDLIAPTAERDGPQVRIYAVTEINRARDNAAPIPGVSEAFDDTRLLLLLSARGLHAFR